MSQAKACWKGTSSPSNAIAGASSPEKSVARSNMGRPPARARAESHCSVAGIRGAAGRGGPGGTGGVGRKLGASSSVSEARPWRESQVAKVAWCAEALPVVGAPSGEANKRSAVRLRRVGGIGAGRPTRGRGRPVKLARRVGLRTAPGAAGARALQVQRGTVAVAAHEPSASGGGRRISAELQSAIPPAQERDNRGP